MSLPGVQTQPDHIDVHKKTEQLEHVESVSKELAGLDDSNVYFQHLTH